MVAHYAGFVSLNCYVNPVTEYLCERGIAVPPVPNSYHGYVATPGGTTRAATQLLHSSGTLNSNLAVYI